jgi:hypothetical protein
MWVSPFGLATEGLLSTRQPVGLDQIGRLSGMLAMEAI